MWQYYLLFGSYTIPRTTDAIPRGAVGYSRGSFADVDPNEFVIDHNGIPRGARALRDTRYDTCSDIASDCFERSIDQGCIIDFQNMQTDCPRSCLLCGNRVQDKVYAIFNAEPQDIPVKGNSVDETLDVMDETQ